MIKKLRTFTGREKAFTLIELLIVIAIIAILTIAFLPGALQAPAKARDAGRQKAVRDIQAAVESYIAENNGVIPPGNAVATPCFTSDLLVASGFSPLPTDPKPQTVAVNTSCGVLGADSADSTLSANKYLYLNKTTFYVVGARVEVRASGNTTAVLGAAAGELGAATTLVAIKAATSKTAGGDLPSVTPPVVNPFFIVIGPR